jgi:hypothetical protein
VTLQPAVRQAKQQIMFKAEASGEGDPNWQQVICCQYFNLQAMPLRFCQRISQNELVEMQISETHF